MPMAFNFQIFTFKTKDSLHLKLDGDFDGSSAHELINTLIAYSIGLWDIIIDTNNLKTINPFGIDVFQKNLNNIKKQLRNLIIVGANKYKFEQG
jgi:anti-anti-sigma regulatory factor